MNLLFDSVSDTEFCIRLENKAYKEPETRFLLYESTHCQLRQDCIALFG